MKNHILLAAVLLPLIASAQRPMTKAELSQFVAQRSQQVALDWREKRIQHAVAVLETLYALPNVRELGWAWPGTLYNLACGYSLLGNKEKSLSFLSEAIHAGFADYELLAKDTDLDLIRPEERFASIVKPLTMSHYRWETPSFQSKYASDLSENDKILGLSRVWSEVKYGFVYFDRVPALDWDSVYAAFLSQVKNTKSTLEYYQLLQRMCSQLRDGHTSINPPNELFRELYARPAVQTSLVEDRVVIVKILNDSLERAGLHRGMEIVSVDGVPVKQYASQSVTPFTCASTPQSQSTDTYEYYLLCGPQDKPVELELKDGDGTARRHRLARNYYRVQSFTKAFEYRVLEGDISYVAVNTFGDRTVSAAFDSLFPLIEKKRALVLDLRDNAGGNSDNAYEILGYLVDRPFPIVQGKSRGYNSYARAKGKVQQWDTIPADELPPHGTKFFSKPVIVLTSSRTGSAAEDFCATFRALKRGKLIGAKTAGSTGQPLMYSLPGGGNGRVCTMRAFGPDGMEFVGIGIEPDIPVRPTLSDVRSGRDPDIDAALAVLKNTRM